MQLQSWISVNSQKKRQRDSSWCRMAVSDCHSRQTDCFRYVAQQLRGSCYLQLTVGTTRGGHYQQSGMLVFQVHKPLKWLFLCFCAHVNYVCIVWLRYVIVGYRKTTWLCSPAVCWDPRRTRMLRTEDESGQCPAVLKDRRSTLEIS